MTQAGKPQTQRNPRQERKAKVLRETLQNSPTKIGEQLANGAVILQIAVKEELDYGTEFTVLAVFKGFHSFITWRYFIGVTEMSDGQNFGPVTPYCWAGEYHARLRKAIADFELRSGTTVK